MAFIAIQRLPGEELESVRRLREAGVKGMRWGVHIQRGDKGTYSPKTFDSMQDAQAHAEELKQEPGTKATVVKGRFKSQEASEGGPGSGPRHGGGKSKPAGSKQRKALFEELDNAKANGYNMMGDPEEIAVDLGTYSQRFEGRNPEGLIPHIKAWQASQRKKSQEAGVKGMHWGQHLDQHIDNLTKSMQSTKDPGARKVLQAKIDKVRDAMTSDLERRLGEVGVKGMKWGNKHDKANAEKLLKQGFKHKPEQEEENGDGGTSHFFEHPDGRGARLDTGSEYVGDYHSYKRGK